MPLRVNFWRSDKPRERILADAFLEGVKARGDIAQEIALPEELPEKLPECDVACMVGVKSRRLFQAHWDAGIHTVYLDKGYLRGGDGGPVKTWEYWRIAVDGHHPTRYLMEMNVKPDRWERLGIRVAPWRTEGRHVVFAGSSEKYHQFYNLRHPTDYAVGIVRKIGKVCSRPVIYRPKPSWRGAVAVAGSEFSVEGSIADALEDAWCLVTHGSNAAYDALVAGVPAVILGDAVTKPISSTEIDEVPNPLLASEKQRMKLLHALAHCQWTVQEMREGQAWQHVLGVMK